MTTAALLEIEERQQDMPKTFAEAKEAGLPVFKFFTDGPAKAVDSTGDGDNSNNSSPRILLTASTNVIDLAGDIITADCLQQMKDAAVGTTIFLNHSFNVPQDVFGVVADAFLAERADEKTGIRYLCLDYIVEVEMSNPAAAKTYEIIKNGKVKLGASITILILESEMLHDGTQSIISVKYLETSVVGMPMNQSSWVRQAVKALKWLEKNPARKSSNPIAVPVKKGIQKMKNKEIVLTRKNAFDGVMSAGASATCQDLCAALCSAIDELLAQADGGDSGDGGGMDNPLGVLKELLSDFEDAVTAHVKPALKALAEPDGDDEANNDAGDNADAGESDASNGGGGDSSDQAASYSIEKARAFFVWKSAQGKLTHKSEADDLVEDPNSGDAGDSGPWQEVHDMSMSKGAVCMGMAGDDTTGDGAGNDSGAQSASLSFDPKKIKNLAVQAQYLELQKKYDEMADAAEAATLALEVFLKQPLV